MTRDEFNTFCASLPQSELAIQWHGSDVWKVGGKIYALCGLYQDRDAFTFKATDLAYQVLSDQKGIRPAPYLASRGLKWLQNFDTLGLPDAELRDHIRASYDMIVANLTRKKRMELGL